MKVLKLLIIEVHNVVGFEALYEKSGLYMAVTIIVKGIFYVIGKVRREGIKVIEKSIESKRLCKIGNIDVIRVYTKVIIRLKVFCVTIEHIVGIRDIEVKRDYKMVQLWRRKADRTNKNKKIAE